MAQGSVLTHEVIHSALDARARAIRIGGALAVLTDRMRHINELIALVRLRVAVHGGPEAVEAADDLQSAHQVLEGTWEELRTLNEELLCPRSVTELLQDRAMSAPVPCVDGEFHQDLLATLAHEIRTPLNAVLGWTRMLRRDVIKPAERAKVLATIEHNAVLQSGLIEDALEAARIGHGQVQLRRQRVELDAIVEGVVFAFRPSAEARRVTIDFRVDEPRSTVVDGDAARLEQVVFNLVSNALKFTPGGGRVDLWLGNTEVDATLKVSDTGQGIASEALPHVFERYRHGSDVARARGGLGLGLAIVRHLVEMHGGTVRCESAGQGAGTTFTLTVPRACGSPPSPAHPQRLGGFRVLVVEDNQDAREVARAILEKAGAQVLALSSAEEALVQLRAWTPDVVLSDLSMPDCDGYGLMRRIRALPPEDGGRVAAVAMTASPRIEDARRAMIEGFQLHVKKPLDPALLVAAIASAAEFRLPRP